MRKLFFSIAIMFFLFFWVNNVHAASCADGGYESCPSWNPSINCPAPFVDCGIDGNTVTHHLYYCAEYTSSVCCLPAAEAEPSCSSKLPEKICSADKLSYQTLNYKCTTSTDSGGATNAKCTLSDTGPTTYCNSGKECQGNLLVSYGSLCQGSGTFTSCVKQYYNPPVVENCLDNNYGKCSVFVAGYNRHYLNTTYKCGNNPLPPYTPNCIIDATTNGDCSIPQRQCITLTDYTITPGTKCVVSPANPPNSAGCISDGTVPVNDKCVSVGSCLSGNGGQFQVARTDNYICNINPSQINNCVTSNFTQTNCNPELRQCVNYNRELQVTPAQNCDPNAANVPADGGTHGVCLASTPNTPINCAVDSQYQCVGDPPLTGQQLIGFCNNSTNPNKCDDVWKPLGSPFPCSNKEVPWPTGEKRCSGAGVEEKMGNIQCIGVGDGTAQPTCGASNPHWKLVQSCSLLCTAWDACDGTNILKTRHCNGCKDLACTSWTEPVSTFDCAPPSEDTASYCSGGVQCTLTAEYSGKCIDPLKNGSAGCESPTVTVVCSGPCGGGGGGGGGPCSPSGSTQACSGGGSQTCGGDGVWGDCECATGSSLPHSECDKDGKCSNVNTCGVSDCSTCGCIPPKASPYSTCVGGKWETSQCC